MENLPQHVGLIIDGNRRWARGHGLPAYEGYLAGYNALKEVSHELVDRGVRYVSVYLFSTENWHRHKDEVSAVMKLIIRILSTDLNELIDQEARVVHLGSREGLSKNVLKAIDSAIEKTAHLDRAVVGLCINYGGQQEITEAVRAIIRAKTPAELVTPELISDNMYGSDMPPVDLIVRSGGDQRLSNFMLWRAAYSEFTFIDKFWP